MKKISIRILTIIIIMLASILTCKKTTTIVYAKKKIDLAKPTITANSSENLITIKWKMKSIKNSKIKGAKIMFATNKKMKNNNTLLLSSKKARKNSYVFTEKSGVVSKDNTYYFKLKLKVGNKWSKWSIVKKARLANSTTEYTYEVKYLKQPYSGEYCNTPWGVYIKTANPEFNKFWLTYYRADGTVATKTVCHRTTYYDLTYPKNVSGQRIIYGQVGKIDGGYIDLSTRSDIFNDENPTGEVSIYLTELKSKYTMNQYYNASESERKKMTTRIYIGKITVLNYTTEHKKWMEDVVAKATNDTMTKSEKMTAIASYLKSNSHYPDVGPRGYALTLMNEMTPNFKKMEFNSYTSGFELCDFGELIGYPVKSLYYKYPTGSAEWGKWHMYVQSDEDGSLYEACPYTTTALHNYQNCKNDDEVFEVIPKIDFQNYTDWYYPY